MILLLLVFALCGLYGNGSLDVGVVPVVKDFEVFVLVFKQRSGFALDIKFGVGEGLTRQLQLDLFQVVAVQVAVAAGPDKLTHFKIALLGHHVGE